MDPYVTVSPNLYDCSIQCDSSTKVIFSGLEQTDVLRLLQLTRNATIYKDYVTPKYSTVSLLVSNHEEPNGDS